MKKVNLINAHWMLGLSAAVLLSSCANNNELFAKYDKSCDLPKTKVVEKIKVVEKVVEKVRYVDRVKTVPAPQVTTSGMSWEPAVYFGFDLDVLDTAEKQRLAKNAEILNKNNKLKVSIQAFTDSKGSSLYNQQLAKKRQAAVVNHLASLGIPDNRLLMSPLGESLPILGSSTKERSINRRVELMLLDEKGRPLALEIQPKQSTFVAPMPVM